VIITFVKLEDNTMWEIFPQTLVEPPSKLTQALRATFAQYGVHSFIHISIDAVFVGFIYGIRTYVLNSIIINDEKYLKI
jgi:hypothetical protein